MTQPYLARIGTLIRTARKHRGWTQQQLADVLNTSQSAINRIERGHQNLTLEMVARIGEALDSELVSFGAGPLHLRVTGPTRLSGSIDVKSTVGEGTTFEVKIPDPTGKNRDRGSAPSSNTDVAA